MIVQFKVSNFLSIREEQVLDFTATSDKTYEERAVVKFGNTRVSKLGVIYGPNASGKTNVLIALSFLMHFFMVRGGFNAENDIKVTPFLMDADSRKKPSTFSLKFYVGEVLYEYSLTLDAHRIYSEELYFHPRNRRALFYERLWNEEKGNSTVTFGTLLGLTSTQKLFIESNCSVTNTVLATYRSANVEKNDAFEEVCSYLEKRVIVDVQSDLERFANQVVKSENGGKEFICEMLERADFNIADLQFRKLKDSPLPQREVLFFTHHTPFYESEFPQRAESDGTNRMYGLSAALFLLIKYNSVFLSDELDASLHHDLLRQFIKTFLVNSTGGQMIFSTHDLLLLDEEYIRRDAVHFVEKGDAGETRLHRAIDFGLSKEASVLSAYRAGKLGAKPQLGGIFLDSNVD